MKVWLVWWTDHQYVDQLIGVYSTEALADAAIAEADHETQLNSSKGSRDLDAPVWQDEKGEAA